MAHDRAEEEEQEQLDCDNDPDHSVTFGQMPVSAVAAAAAAPQLLDQPSSSESGRSEPEHPPCYSALMIFQA